MITVIKKSEITNFLRQEAENRGDVMGYDIVIA